MTALRRLLNSYAKSPLAPIWTLQQLWESLKLLLLLVSNLVALLANLLILPLVFILDIVIITYEGFVAIKKTLLRRF